MTKRQTLVFTPESLVTLKRYYAKAKLEGADTFMFNGNEFVTGYAKYLIEFLEAAFADRPGKDGTVKL